MTDNSSIDTSVTNVWRAWRAFRCGKKPSRTIMIFEAGLEMNLLKLAHGNLTSQLFANIYLNEFDRFVRHTFRPLGYVRYGDDFVAIAANRSDILEIRGQAIRWLKNELFLTAHSINDAVFQARQGVHFLGHRIYPTSFVVESAMRRKIACQISSRNSASYHA